MHFVGKVLIVVQLVLSVCFMAFAGAVYAVKENWRQAHATLSESHQRLGQEKQTLEQEYENAKNKSAQDLQTAQNEAARLQAELKTEQDKVQTLTTQLQAVRAEREKLLAYSDINDREAKERRAEALEQREINLALHADRDAKRLKITELEDNLFEQQIQIAKMEQKQDRVLTELALWRKAARFTGLDPDPRQYVGRQDPPPQVYGKIVNTRGGQGRDEDYVEISVGSDDGLEKGHELYVYRTGDRGQYMGKIRVVYLTADRAVGVVTSKSKTGQIQVGDNVTTQL
ncbi:MAG: hypothetical protein KY476_08610 [Planctomycetes bacterium]|nr:hypothetical protein [Planctomycetota bacterium]